MRVYRLLRIGVSLEAITGEVEMPGALGDWLIAVDDIYQHAEREWQAKLAGATTE